MKYIIQVVNSPPLSPQIKDDYEIDGQVKPDTR